MSDAVVRVHPETPLGTISPRIYGHFAEHLGRCCYDGLVPKTAGVETEGIFRKDVLEALKNMPTPLLRWPGGCYADHYHWQDGIGTERPRRLGMSCGEQVEEDNRLGTHEFLQLCALIGAEPYLAGNMGTGTPQEMCDWMEYCNSTRNTTLTELRKKNGQERPWDIKLWGVGNENWGCGGNYDAEGYAREYRRYATMLRHVDPYAELVVCGLEDEWNSSLLHTLHNHANLIDHLSIHRYWGGGAEMGFTEDGYYNLIAQADQTEAFISHTADIIKSAVGIKQKIGVALDEWGAWHKEAVLDFDLISEPGPYEAVSTLRDAIAAAVALEGFHRQCKVLTLANLAQVVNVLQAPIQTLGAKMWCTPTYYVFQMHSPHRGAAALYTETLAATGLPDGAPATTATASLAADGSVAVTVINRHYSETALVSVQGLQGSPKITASLLTAASSEAHNGPETPEAVVPIEITVEEGIAEAGFRITLPPHSLATLRFTYV